MPRVSRVSGRRSKVRREKRRTTGKGFAEIRRKKKEIRAPKMEEIKAGMVPMARVTGSTAKEGRVKAKRVRERKEPRAKTTTTTTKTKPLIMAQPLSARGAYAKRTEIKVPSTVIFWVEYYPGHERLIIAFRGSGKYYTYYNVPLSIFQAFKLAPSKGRYFNKYIKNKFDFLPGARRP